MNCLNPDLARGQHTWVFCFKKTGGKGVSGFEVSPPALTVDRREQEPACSTAAQHQPAEAATHEPRWIHVLLNPSFTSTKTILLKSKSETVPIKSVEVTNSGTEHKQETQQLHAACFRTRETAVEMQFIIRGNEELREWERSTCSV